MQKRIRLFGMFAALFVLFISFGHLPANAQTTGSISGTVTATDTSDPLENVLVYAYLPNDSTSFPVTAYTGTNGAYEIAGLTEGDYIVRAYISEKNYIAEYYNDAIYYADITTVTVTAGGNTDDIDFELAPGGAISGTVVDEYGAGIGNTMLRVWYDCNGTYLASAVTDASGAYTITGLPAGSVYLYAGDTPLSSISYVSEWYGDAEFCSLSTPVEVTIGSTTEEIDFQLELAGAISGTIYESDGTTPIANMPVGIFSDPCDEMPFVSTLTSTSGTYSFDGLEAGDVYIKAFYDEFFSSDIADTHLRQWFVSALSCEDAMPVSIYAGYETGEIDFLLSDNTDTDGDGMPDEWEFYYFGDLSRDGAGDFDEDGATDLQEYEEGTDPNPLGVDTFIDGDTDSDPDTSNSGGGGGGCFISILSI